ncbi:gag protease polyprotein [Cucumis melo var. makuwa]|uniref:Gag protease polyprotein n=1 Tax=Cucumis melo var. makuwa TaxID=1194695 RepID=A0A5A7VL10_CUCMM|nr:gag protease polyprotein [Cucumis melo var. makuwa]
MQPATVVGARRRLSGIVVSMVLMYAVTPRIFERAPPPPRHLLLLLRSSTDQSRRLASIFLSVRASSPAFRPHTAISPSISLRSLSPSQSSPPSQHRVAVAATALPFRISSRAHGASHRRAPLHRSSAALKQSRSSNASKPRIIPAIERGRSVARGCPGSVIASGSLCTIVCNELFTDRHRCPDVLCTVRVQRGADRRGARRMREGHMDASGFLYASADSLSFRFCRLTYDVSLCLVSLWLKRSLPLVREMPPRRGARRGGRGGRGRGVGRVQPEVQPVAQATDQVAPVTHADLAAMEQRFRDLIMQMQEQQ